MAAITGTGALSIPAFTLAGDGPRGVEGSGNPTLGSLTLDGDGVLGRSGVGALTTPSLVLSGAGVRGITGTGNLILPLLLLDSTVIMPDPTIWDTDNQAWGDADFIYSEAKPVMILGNAFAQVDNGTNFGDTPVQVTLTRTGLAITGRDRFGEWKVDPSVIKEITGLFPMIKGIPGTVIQVSIGSQERPDDPVYWEGPYLFTLGQGFFQDFTVSGRYLAIRLESTGQEPWELLSYDLDLVEVGGR